jgi:predicted O-methyltransferase YrrM
MDDTAALIETLYSAGYAIGKNGKKFDLGCISTRRNLETIERLMKQFSPSNTLEVGFGFGGSAVVFAAMHRNHNPNGHRAHIAIDPYQSTQWDCAGRLKLQEADLSDFVEILEEKSSIALPRLLAEGRQFGMIYIDGSHVFEDVFVDAYYAVRLLKIDGYILFDDSADSHVAKVLAFINSSIPSLERQAEVTVRQKIARYLGKRQLTIYRRIGAVDREWTSRLKRF